MSDTKHYAACPSCKLDREIRFTGGGLPHSGEYEVDCTECSTRFLVAIENITKAVQELGEEI